MIELTAAQQSVRVVVPLDSSPLSEAALSSSSVIGSCVTRPLTVAALLAACAIGFSACAADDGSAVRSSAPPPSSNFRAQLRDLNSQELIGMTENQIQARLYTVKHVTAGSGMAELNHFGGVKYLHQVIDLTRLIDPARAQEYAEYTDEFTAVAACVRHDEDADGYYIFVGGLPNTLMAPDVLVQAERGEFNKHLTAYNGCEAPGPVVPLSLSD